MRKPKSRADSSASSRVPQRRRKLRSRPKPKWLTSIGELDAIAQRRCLLILSVLSGEKPVTEAVVEAGMTRPLYYLLEKRALVAMLRALTPGSESDGDGDSGTWASRVKTLEENVLRLEREKRRTERLLFLTRKLLRPGPFKTKSGRKPMTKATSASSRRAKASKMRPRSMTPTVSPSIPTKDGGGES